MFSPILRHSRGLCILALITAALLIACEGGAGPSAPSAAEESATGAPQTPTPETTLTPEAASATILTPTPTPPPPTIPAQVQTPVPAQTRVATSPETDRQALIAIYEALGGAEWKRQENWLSEKPLWSQYGGWYGIQTDSSGRVTRLNLSNINLTGELPPELWELTELRDLLLNGNPGLTGGIPSGIGNLAKLEVLRLDQTGLSGELPPEVGELPLMNAGEYRGSDYIERGIYGRSAYLGIDSTRLCVPPELEEALLSKLSLGRQYYGVLCEERERLEGIYEALGGAEWKRQENWLSEKPLGSVSEPSWYGVETDSNGRVTRLKLNSINLKGELPPELWELTELKDLLLYDNPGLTGGIPSGIGNLAKLEVLRLDQTGLSGELPPEVGELPLMNAGEYRGSDYIERGIYGRSAYLGIDSTRLCVPPELEEALLSKLSLGRQYYGVLCEERERLEGIYEALGGA